MFSTADAETAVQVIASLGGRPLLVGGFVRDCFLRIESKDIDIEVHGPVSPDDLRVALSKHGRVDAVGMSFGVLKFGRDVDVSFPRRDSKTGEGHTGFAIEFDQDMTVEEALARRDFTINSIAIDAITGEVIDPFGGQADIEAKIIRHTSEAFADDPLRVLRAVQFAGRFGFTIASETAELCQSIRLSFHDLSIERVWMEWSKILTKGKSMRAVSESLVVTGWEGHFRQWGRGEFTDVVLSKADRQPDMTPERRSAIVLGSMFACRGVELRKHLADIDAPGWLRHDAVALAQHHEINTGSLDVTLRRIARTLGSVRLRDWLLCRFIFSGPVFERAHGLGILDAAQPALLTGHHLIDAGLHPGPEFGTILAAALEAQDIEGWTTEAEAVHWFALRIA